MAKCSCGDSFATYTALRQHQTAKGSCAPPASIKASRSRSSHAPKDTWLWKHVFKRATVHRIKCDETEPSSLLVTSSLGCDLVCSYNWRTGKDLKDIHIPGHAAVWQNLELPVILPQDEGLYFIDQNAALAPKFPFEPMFRATVSMNPAFRFDNIDVLTNRNSLRKLLDFSAGRRRDSFRLNLHLVNRTLVIERCEKNVRQLIHGSKDPGWGKVFERRSTQYPTGLEDSASHHRSLQYQLGDLRCVVQFEVDACYNQVDESCVAVDALTSVMDQLTINTGNHDNAATSRPGKRNIARVQETAAEIKTAKGPKSIAQHLPQLWLGRTPWLIVGLHSQGTFKECRMTDASARFADWEQRNQRNLRVLVTVLGQLREAVEKNAGQHCVAICQKTGSPPVIEVFPSTAARAGVPDDLKAMLWSTEGVRSSNGSRL